MKVPLEIRQIERPKNTIVVPYKTKNEICYEVKSRRGCKVVNGKNHPISGVVIGYIKDNQFVPREESVPERVSVSESDIKVWASISLCDRLFKPIQEELALYFHPDDVIKLYCMAILRVLFPGVPDCRLYKKYAYSFLSELYPGVPLCKNTVSQFLEDIGKAKTKRVGFMRQRIKEMAGPFSTLLVDGTLKTFTSKRCFLSAPSRKTRKKGVDQISVLYIYNPETREVLAYKVFPGNIIDTAAYLEFLKEIDVKEGLLLGDKAFIDTVIADVLKANPSLHYLFPLRRNSRYIKEYGLDEFEDVLKDNKKVFFRKQEVWEIDKKTGGVQHFFLYRFKDLDLQNKESKSFIVRHKDDFDWDEYMQDYLKEGTILLKSDLDMSPEEAYKAYIGRWEIEVVMSYYKTALDFDDTREHCEFTVEGSEFVNFLSVILTLRLLDYFDEKGISEYISYSETIDLLNSAEKSRNPGEEWRLRVMIEADKKVLRDLELIEPEKLLPGPKPKAEQKEKKRRGRPPKEQNDKKTAKTAQEKGSEEETEAEKKAKEKLEKQMEADKPKKRGPGRPPGSKNKKTLLREAEEKAKIEAAKKKLQEEMEKKSSS